MTYELRFHIHRKKKEGREVFVADDKGEVKSLDVHASNTPLASAMVVSKLRTILYKCVFIMDIESEHKVPVKRKSRGRSKGGKGKSALVQCSGCGELVPRDKAKKVSRRVSMVDYALAKELRQKGAYIASPVDIRYYCVSCAVHRGVVKVRARDERKQPWRRH
jgi:small subunit ribosomal protein S26e